MIFFHKHSIRTALVFFLISLLSGGLSNLQAVTPDKSSETPQIRDLVDTYNLLLANCEQYNQINDSVFMPATRGTWVKRFQRRAVQFQQIYASNSQLTKHYLELCHTMHAHDVAQFSDDLRYSDYSKLCNENAHIRTLGEVVDVTFFNPTKHGIPFITEMMVNDLAPEMLEHMPHSEYALMIYALLVKVKYEMSLLNDPESGRKMVEYAQKMLEFEPRFNEFSSDKVRLLFLTAYQHLLYVGLIRQGAITPQQALSYWNHAKQLRTAYPKLFNSRKNQEFLALLNRNIDGFDIHFAMSYIMPKGGWDYHEPIGDSLVNCYLNRVEADSSFYTVGEYCQYASAMCYLGSWSANDMFQHAADFYANAEAPDEIKVANVVQMAYIAKNLNYMLNMTDRSEIEKRHFITQGYERILRNIRVCSDRQYDFELADVARKMLCDRVARRYLSSSQIITFIKEMMLATQCQTYAHSSMVSQLSQMVLDGVIESRPDLLVGVLGIKSVEEVPDSSMSLSIFLDNAAMLHDVGKLTMIEVVRNDYHPLTDHEFQILKEHPHRGLQFVAGKDDMLPFQDFMLGHHKWYDESHGYPEDFNHQTSRYRILVEILTIADCMDAATDKLGRNYARKKTFDDVVLELRSGSGTRYNPDLVDVIINNQTLNNDLRELLDRGWLYNYYNVYKAYFGL